MEATPLELKLDFPIWLMLAIGFVIGLSFAVSRRHRTSIAATIAKLLVVAVAIGVAAAFFSDSGSHPVRSVANRVEVSEVERVPQPPSIKSTAAPEDLESSKSSTELPEWTRQPVRIDGNRKVIVVSSGRFASEEEAELHGVQAATEAAAKEYVSLDPNGRGAVQSQHSDLVKESAIKLRHLESTQHDFGKFQAPMYQLWMQVELTPELGERLAEPWRQAAVSARLRTLAGWGLWGTAAAALAAFALRIDSAWNGRHRAVITGTAITLALGSLAFLA